MPAASVPGLVVQRPGGALVRPEGSGAVRMADAGMYFAYRDQAVGTPVAMAAANAPASESDLRTMAPAELLVGVGEDADSALAVAGVTVGELESRQRIWKYLLASVALLLVAETVLATAGWRRANRPMVKAFPDGGAA